MRIAVVIPALNEAETIQSVIQKVPPRIAGSKDIHIIVVNDGSSDQTDALARQAGAIVVSHQHNQGVSKAIKTGIDTALSLRAEIMVNIDADGQFDPADIEKLIHHLQQEKADLVVGDRFTDPQTGKIRRPPHMPQSRYWGNRLVATFVNQLCRIHLTDVSSGFRAYTYQALLSLNLTDRIDYTQEMVLDLVSKKMIVSSVSVPVKYFPQRESRVAHSLLIYSYETLKLIVRSFRDYKPLVFFVTVSLPFFLLSIFLGSILLGQFFGYGLPTNHVVIRFWGVYCFTIAFFLWVIGFFADMIVRLRQNQEHLLYLHKRDYYGYRNHPSIVVNQ